MIIISTYVGNTKKSETRENDNYSNWAIISYGVYKGLYYLLLVANNKTIHSLTSTIVISCC